MAMQSINVGSAANSKNGDPLRTAFIKINENFTELYNSDTNTKYHLGDEEIFVDLDPDTGIVVIQSQFDSSMPVYIKGANCSDGGVGGNVVIEAGGAPLPNNGTTGNIELAANIVTVEANNNLWTFNDSGVLELPDNVGDIWLNGSSILGTSSNELVNSDYTFTLETNGTLTLPNTGTISNTGESISGSGNIYTFATDAVLATPAINNINEIWLETTAESIAIQPGWIITFANNSQKTVDVNEAGIMPPHVGQHHITWTGNITLSSADVWPLTVQSANYSAGSDIKQIDLSPDGTVIWSISSNGYLSMPEGQNIFDNGDTDSGLNIRSNNTDGSIYLYSYGTDGSGTGAGNIYVTPSNVEIYSDWQNGGVGEKKWSFESNGRTIFPVVAVPPLTEKGAAGDKAGAVVFDSGYLYYCAADYTTGTINIWVRVLLGETTWDNT